MGAEFLEGFCLDLTNTLTCDSELFPDLFECMHLSAIESKSHDDDLLLTRREEIKHFVEVFLED